MTGRTTKYIRAFRFQTTDGFTLSDPALITATGARVRLATQRRPVYMPGRGVEYFSTEDDIFVRTEAFAPGVLTSFGFVEPIGATPKDLDLVAVTSFAYRLHDGTDSRYWGGASWDIAGAGDWNSLADFNLNLATYAGASIAIEIRLNTTDEFITPILRGVCLLWTGEAVDSYAEWIYRVAIRSLKANIRPLTSFTSPGDGTTTIDVGAFDFDADFDIVDVVAVYDHTDDPLHTTNLLANYVGGIATLTSAIPAGNNAWLTASYAPDVAVTTSSDFVAGAKVPAIWVTAIASPLPPRTLGIDGGAIIDRSVSPLTGAAFPLPVSLVNLDFTIAVIAPTALDLTGLTNAYLGWAKANATLRSPAYDEKVTLKPGSGPGWATGNSDVDDTRMNSNFFSLRNVPIYIDPQASNASGVGAETGPIDVFGVERVNMAFRRPNAAGDETITIQE